MNDAEVYRRIADGLAVHQVPDFLPADAPDVARAMQAAVPFGAPPDAAWVSMLQQNVHDASQGSVALEQVADDQYPGPLLKGPAVYVRLQGATTYYAALGDYMPPVVFSS